MSKNEATKLIKQGRKKLKLTQEEMARHIGLTQNTYSKKERGDRRFKIEEIEMIINLLETNSEYKIVNKLIISTNRNEIDKITVKKLQQLSKIINKMRKNKGITQTNLGELIGINNGTYSRKENMKSDFKIGELIGIIELLKMQEEYGTCKKIKHLLFGDI